MKKYLYVGLTLLCSFLLVRAMADTPPARVINAEMYDAAGNPITSTGGKIDVNASGSVSVSAISGSVSLPTGASTAAKQDLGNASVSSIDGKLNSLGQKSSDFSMPVVISSDQPAIPISGSVTANNGSVANTSSSAPSMATYIGGLGAGGLLQPLTVTATNALKVDGSAVTQPVSAASLPLPSGAATSANQSTGNASLSSIDGKVPAGLTVASSRLKVDGSDVTQPVSASTLPLPSGASTAANQATGNASLSSIDGKITAVNTGNVTVSSSALPTGAATSANQSTGNTSLASIDGKLNSLGQKAMAASVPVTMASNQSAMLVDGSGVTQPVSGTVTSNAGTGTFTVGQATGTNLHTVVDSGSISSSQSGTWNLNNISGTISLPTGAATSANQTTANSSLSSLDGKFSSLGQKASASSTPVVISSDQSAIPITGSVTANNSSVSNVDASVPSMATFVAGLNPSGLLRPLTVTASNALKVDGSSVTQPVSVSSLPLPTGASTSAKQDTGNTSLGSIDAKITAVDTGNVTVASSTLPTGAATSAKQDTGNTSLSSIDGKVPANLTVTSTRLLVDGSGVTQPVSAASLPLPSGASTSAKQDTGNTSLSSIDTKVPSNLTVSSTRLLVDGSGVVQPASQSGTWNINNISGTVSLPTGASTSANQSTANSSLASLDGKFNSLGQKTMANSSPVVISSDQSAIPISGSVTATNPSVSDVDLAVPSMATFVAALNPSGVLRPLTVTATNALKTDGSSVTQPVSAASLPLPSGASTAAKQPSLGTAGTASADVITVQGIASMTALKTDGSAVTQPVSGTVSAAQSGTWNITNVSGTVSLPTGASTSANQSTANTSLASIDGKLNSLGQKVSASSVPVVVSSDQSTLTVTDGALGNVNATAPSMATYIGALDSGGLMRPLTVTATNALKIDGSATTQPVSAASLPLPSGAATSANQTTANSSLSSIDGKLNSLGQKTMVNSVPVVISSNQSAVVVDGSGVTQPVSGTITANIGTSGSLALDASVTGLQVGQNSTTSGQNGDLVQGAVTTAAPSYTTAKTSPLSLNTSGGLRVDGSGVTQPVSGTVSAAQSGTWNITNVSGTVSLPTGASTAAKQPALGTAGTASADVISVQGIASMTALKVDGSAVTQPVSLSSTNSPINSAGTIANSTSITTTATTFTAPSNATGFIFEAESSNTDNIRYSVGSTATSTTGMLMEPGRDSGYVPMGANISAIAISGTQKASVQWIQTH